MENLNRHKISNNLYINPTDWGECFIENLMEVFRCTDIHFQSILLGSPQHNIPCTIHHWNVDSPKCRGNRENHHIYLTAKDRVWDQYTYQFSHEYCHHLINLDLKRNLVGAFWFEETICELASLYCLKKNAISWAINPPYRNWYSYANNFIDYFEKTVSDRYFIDVSIGQYIRRNLTLLEKPNYERKIYLTIAYHLLDLFLEYPILWNIILFFKYTNYENKERYASFYSFLCELEVVIPDCLKYHYALLKQRLME